VVGVDVVVDVVDTNEHDNISDTTIFVFNLKRASFFLRHPIRSIADFVFSRIHKCEEITWYVSSPPPSYTDIVGRFSYPHAFTSMRYTFYGLQFYTSAVTHVGQMDCDKRDCLNHDHFGPARWLMGHAGRKPLLDRAWA
jgi:hypothetical protein